MSAAGTGAVIVGRLHLHFKIATVCCLSVAAILGTTGCSKPTNEAATTTISADADIPAAADSSVQDSTGTGRFEGFGRDRNGYCRIAISVQSRDDALRNFEASLGTRIVERYLFADGVIVEFRDGFRTAIWEKEIDCKDPPYDPFPKNEEPDGSGEPLPAPIEALPQPETTEESPQIVIAADS